MNALRKVKSYGLESASLDAEPARHVGAAAAQRTKSMANLGCPDA